MNKLLSQGLAATALAWALATPGWAQSAKAVYDSTCAGCHATGVLGAPKPGDTAAWSARAAAKGGVDGLVKSAIAGTPKGMPPRGGKADLADPQLRAVVVFMMGDAAQAAVPKPAAAAAPKAAAAAPATATPRAVAAAAAPAPARAGGGAAAAKPVVADPPAAPPAATGGAAAAPAGTASVAPAVAPAATATAAAVAAAAATAAPAPTASAEVNAFNRLLKPLGRYNRPAMESGIHDPANDMTAQLQPPATAFATLPKSNAGNHVDWVKALDGKTIQPRWDRNDVKAAAVVMDMNIVREVKGSMPDVVYPHKQHTEWLDCSNCHPAIFVPQKGANQITMASILLGQKCGVCHGKVAFPVSECRLCHSRKKTTTTAAAPAETKP